MNLYHNAVVGGRGGRERELEDSVSFSLNLAAIIVL